MRTGIILLIGILCAGCSAKPAPPPAPAGDAKAQPVPAPDTTQAQAAPTEKPSPAGGPASAPATNQDCGPAVANEASAVRIAALDAFVTQALKDAAALHRKIGPIVLGEESRIGPRQVSLHDTSPEVVEHFAGHTPPVGNYSTAFKVENGHTVRNPDAMMITTAEICWRDASHAEVRARQLSSGMNRSSIIMLEKQGETWTVTALATR